jgi:hypothetical protein
MKPKAAESAAKTAGLQTAKDVLPAALLGRQREPAPVRRPQEADSEERTDPKSLVTYLDQHFAEWTPACEVVDHKDPKGVFKEDNYDYLELPRTEVCVWKRASKFFSIQTVLESSPTKPAVFLQTQDDIFQKKAAPKFPGLIDDTQVAYQRVDLEVARDLTVCDFEEEEESDTALALRQVESDRDFKPKPGQKKPVLVS